MQGKYDYYSKSQNDKYFDNKKYNDFIAKDDYESAISYLDNFVFYDAEVNDDYQLEIQKLKREGQIKQAKQQKIKQYGLDKNKIQFYEAFRGDNLVTVQNANIQNGTSNELIDTFLHNYDLLFNKGDEFEFTFRDKGWFGYDMSDGFAGSATFLENLGATRELLEESGVRFTEDGDNTIIKINKNNPYFKDFLENIPSIYTKPAYFAAALGISYYDRNTNNKISLTNYKNIQLLNKTISQILVSKAENIKLDENTSSLERVYSSVVGGNILDVTEAQQQVFSGNLTSEQYNIYMKVRQRAINSHLKGGSIRNKRIYSNIANSNMTDNTLNDLDNINRGWAEHIISAANPDDMTIQAMSSNGEIGALVTIDAGSLDKKWIEELPNELKVVKNQGKIQFFIPGLFAAKAQQLLDKDTSTRAKTEINNMKDYEYEYEFKTVSPNSSYGGGIKYDPNKGKFMYYNMTNLFDYGEFDIDEETATKLIDADMAVRRVSSALDSKFRNDSGEEIQNEQKDNMAKINAIRIANEIYPETILEDTEGNELDLTKKETIKYIFNPEIMGNGGGSTSLRANVNVPLLFKYRLIYDIYYRLMPYSVR